MSKKSKFSQHTKDRLLETTIFIQATASGFFTYRGLSIMADSFTEKAAATVFGVATVFAINHFWRDTLKKLPKETNPKTRAQSIKLVAAVMVGIASLSSIPNVVGLVGEDAMLKNLDEIVVRTEQAASESYDQALDVESLALSLDQQATRYSNASEIEFSSGGYTGSQGTGKIHLALGMVSDRFELSAEQLDGFVKRSRNRQKSIQSRLRTMQRIVNSDLPYKEKFRKIKGHVDEVRAMQADLDAGVLVSSIARSLDGVSRELDLQSRSSSRSALAQQQAAAGTRLKADIDETVSGLTDQISALTEADTHRVPSVERESALYMVTRNIGQYWSYLIAGFALDAAPLSLLLLYCFSGWKRTEEDIETEVLLSTTTAEVMRAEHARTLQGQAHLGPDDIRRINDILFGRKKGGSK